MSDKPHRHWDKMVSAAYLRMLNATQEEAAEAVGRAERTIRSWEDDPRWSKAKEEAKDRWLSNLGNKCRARLLTVVEDTDDPDKLVGILERIDERLRPAEKKFKVDSNVSVDTGDARERLASQLASASTGGEENGAAAARAHRNGGGGS